MKKSVAIKLAAGALAIGVFAMLFMRSLEDTRSEAYTVDSAHLQSWTLALEAASSPNDPLLVLRPSPDLASGLFKQIFSRAMESLHSPTTPSIPLVLRGEFDRVVGDQLTQEAMMAAAKGAGIENGDVPDERLVELVRNVSEVEPDPPLRLRLTRRFGSQRIAKDGVPRGPNTADDPPVPALR